MQDTLGLRFAQVRTPERAPQRGALTMAEAGKRPDLKTLQAEVDRFNKACPVGTAVTVQADDGTLMYDVVTDPPEVLNGHTAVGWFAGITGCYLLSRVAKG